MKLFTSRSPVTVPCAWRTGMGLRPAHSQLYVAAVAADKTALAAMLQSAGDAARNARELRLANPLILADDEALLVRHGVIDLTRPALYAWPGMVHNKPIGRIEPDGTVTVPARWVMLPKPGGLRNCEMSIERLAT